MLTQLCKENLAHSEQSSSIDPLTGLDLFYQDVLKGLKAKEKFLFSKYFYDQKGDQLFQEIMNCPEYYPFQCELEIYRQKAVEISKLVMGDSSPFELIELGAGDCTKSIHLLRALVAANANFTYRPIDISNYIITYLERELIARLPHMKVEGLTGEYFPMLKQASQLSQNRKAILFLGSNIGNMSIDDARQFCKNLRQLLNPGDMVIIGVDLKKSPSVILAAYNDPAGITKRFNLNLLERINAELDGDFNTDQFEHFPVYDPASGACKSYLISKADQSVKIRYAGKEEVIELRKDEEIFTEISQKYTAVQVEELASSASFRTIQNFYDDKRWFMDAIWVAE